MNAAFERSAALLGGAAMERLARARVLVVGVGGVGGWCAEALARTGLGHMTLVDDDVVVPSNMNRQSPAASSTLGRRKVDAMREKLLDACPGIDVAAECARFEKWRTGMGFDAVVDAIDSVDCKAELVLGATEEGVPLFSSMGAALRTDPTAVRLSRFSKVEGDGLARALRNRFKRLGRRPAIDFTCAWSVEPPAKCDERGSLMQVTAAFGLCLASAVIDSLCGKLERRS